MLISGRYRVGKTIGAGGMAEVRDAWDTQLDRPVAIKLLHPLLGAQPEMRQRFREEARAAAGLNHPNIVSVFDSGEHDGIPFIVMERLPGTSVADELAAGALPSDRVRSVLDDVLGALGAAHGAGILHRDVKPGNILHTPSSQSVKLADFGIAKALDAGKNTKTGEMLGTMAYLSPERIAGAPASVADDLYAVGVVGFEALTGHSRFSHDNAGALAHAIMTVQPPPLSVLRPEADPDLAAVIDRATAPGPHERFGAAADMRSALHGRANVPIRTQTKVLETPLPHQPASLAYVRPRRRSAGRRTRLLAGIGVGLIAAVATTTIVLAASRAPSVPVVSVPEPAPTSASPVPTPPPVSTPAPAPPPVPVPAENSNRGNGNGNGNGKKDKKRDD